MPGPSSHKILFPRADPDKKVWIDGKVWNDLVTLVEKMSWTANVQSQSIRITRGESVTKIEVVAGDGTNLAKIRTREVAACDDAGQTVRLKLLTA